VEVVKQSWMEVPCGTIKGVTTFSGRSFAMNRIFLISSGSYSALYSNSARVPESFPGRRWRRGQWDNSQTGPCQC